MVGCSVKQVKCTAACWLRFLWTSGADEALGEYSRQNSEEIKRTGNPGLKTRRCVNPLHHGAVLMLVSPTINARSFVDLNSLEYTGRA